MTVQEHLLIQVMEECDEISQRAAKAIRFGLNEVQEGQPLSNIERVLEEINDLVGVVSFMKEKHIIPEGMLIFNQKLIQNKKGKIIEWLEFSVKEGTVEDPENVAL